MPPTQPAGPQAQPAGGAGDLDPLPLVDGGRGDRDGADRAVRSPQHEVASIGWKTMAGLLMDGAEPGSRTLLAAHPVFRESTAPVAMR